MPLSDALGFLIRSHYLADDFPSVITTANFAEFCVKKHSSLETVKALLGRTTLYGTFSAPRTVTSRRVLALPHPTNQLALSLIIVRNLKEIKETIRSSKITLYNTYSKAKEDRVFVGIDFKARARRKQKYFLDTL